MRQVQRNMSRSECSETDVFCALDISDALRSGLAVVAANNSCLEKPHRCSAGQRHECAVPGAVAFVRDNNAILGQQCDAMYSITW